MNLILLIPKVVRGYVSQFPEVRHNAYSYFNYDNRVVDESVDRCDDKRAYKGPDDLTDMDYDALVCYAKTLVNPTLVQYSPKVACEDALSLAIRDFNNGMYDGKINANHYNVLLQSMMQPQMPIMAAKKKEKKPETEKRVHPAVLKQLGLKPEELPLKQRVRTQKREGPVIYRTKGRTVIKKKSSEEGPNPYIMDFLNIVQQLPTNDMEVARKLVGRWGQAKAAIKEFLQNATKEYDMDSDYVKSVSENFKKASDIIDKLEKLYSGIKEFDFEDIKTYLEPLQELIDKSQGPAESAPPEEAPEAEITEEETITEPKEGSMLKNAKEYTERLDKIADEVQQIDPDVAMQIDLVSDVIEGRREATSLKWDADEARYMANRFDYRVRSREADEPYMDGFNQSNFEQVMREKQNPKPVRKASTLPPYRKIQKTEE